MIKPWFVTITPEEVAELRQREEAERQASQPYREAAAQRMREYNRKAHEALTVAMIEEAKTTGRAKFRARREVDEAVIAAARNDVGYAMARYRTADDGRGYVNVYGEKITKHFHIFTH